MTFGEKIIEFYANLKAPSGLPKGVEVLHPYLSKEVMSIVQEFYTKFYSDDRPRTFLIGINPGRLGGGATGIPFTDPIRLHEEAGIPNKLPETSELSSRFIYQMINAYGGVKKFYGSCYFTSVSPLGFVKDGKNLNYYDIKALESALSDYIYESLEQQVKFGANPIAYSIGKGQNIKYLKAFNKKYKLFKAVEPLPHPRWVMQYRLKRLDDFLKEYVDTLS